MNNQDNKGLPKEMKLRFFYPRKSFNASIQASGRLMFTNEASKRLSLVNYKSASIAVNEDTTNDENIYCFLSKEKKDENFTILNYGKTHYLSLKSVFDQMGIDYKSKKIIYDIVIEKDMLKFVKK